MREETTTEEDPTAGLKRPVPWTVVEVRATTDRVLFVRFVDGVQGDVDLSLLVDGAEPGVFAALKDADLFRRVFVDHGVVTWPGELDLAPDAMHDAIRDHGVWRPD
jgi:hypothetical protein